MGLGHAVKFTQVVLGLVPEIFNCHDMILTVGKQIGMIDPQMPKAGHVQGIITRQRITVDDGVRQDPLF
jgi:hypothetical protein